MREQAELSLSSHAPSKAPKICQAEIDQVLAILDRAATWMTALEIAAQMPPRPGLDRRVRAVASAARPQIVSFPGSPGYKLWQHCTVEEINHCIETFNSQGSDMINSAKLYSQAYYRRFRGQPLSP